MRGHERTERDVWDGHWTTGRGDSFAAACTCGWEGPWRHAYGSERAKGGLVRMLDDTYAEHLVAARRPAGEAS